MLALKIGVFLLTLSLGIIASALGRIEIREAPASQSATIDHTCHPRTDGVFDPRCLKPTGSDSHSVPSGSGSAFCNGTSRGPLETELPGEGVKNSDTSTTDPKAPRVTTPLKITYKQKANYTAEARENGVEGTVVLRVTFLASGGIGIITTIKGLPFGLTEQAIEAVRKMRFEPEKVDGRPRTTSRPVSFTFNLH